MVRTGFPRWHMQGVFSWIESQRPGHSSCRLSTGSKDRFALNNGEILSRVPDRLLWVPTRMAKNTGVTQQNGPETAPLLSDPAPYWDWL